MDTINSLTFEENPQEDPSFNCADDPAESDYSTSESEQESMEEASMEQASCEEMTKNMDQLDIEQIPVGVDKLTIARNNKTVEGEILVFASPEEEDIPEQTINELDTQELDGDEDVSFNCEALAEAERDQEEADEECEDSERESVDGEDLNGVTVHTTSDGEKLVFSDVVEFRAQHGEKPSAASDNEEEEEVSIGTEGMTSTEKYIEEEDPDFNPVYCDQTLSDVDIEDEGEEDVPSAQRLANNNCILRIDEPMIIPPREEEEEETAEEMSQEAPSMEC